MCHQLSTYPLSLQLGELAGLDAKLWLPTRTAGAAPPFTIDVAILAVCCPAVTTGDTDCDTQLSAWPPPPMSALEITRGQKTALITIHKPTTTNTAPSTISQAPPMLLTAASICFVMIFPSAHPRGHSSRLIKVRKYRIPMLLVPESVQRPMKTGAAAMVISSRNCCNNCISQ